MSYLRFFYVILKKRVFLYLVIFGSSISINIIFFNVIYIIIQYGNDNIPDEFTEIIQFSFFNFFQYSFSLIDILILIFIL